MNDFDRLGWEFLGVVTIITALIVFLAYCRVRGIIRPDRRDDDLSPPEWISEYANATGRYGPDSEQSLAVRAKYAGDQAFADFAYGYDAIKRRVGGSGIDWPARQD